MIWSFDTFELVADAGMNLERSFFPSIFFFSVMTNSACVFRMRTAIRVRMAWKPYDVDRFGKRDLSPCHFNAFVNRYFHLKKIHLLTHIFGELIIVHFTDECHGQQRDRNVGRRGVESGMFQFICNSRAIARVHTNDGRWSCLGLAMTINSSWSSWFSREIFLINIPLRNRTRILSLASEGQARTQRLIKGEVNILSGECIFLDWIGMPVD